MSIFSTSLALSRRRLLLAQAGALVSWLSCPSLARAVEPFDFQRARAAYLARLASLKQAGQLPVIDVESSYNPLAIDLPAFTAAMDKAGIALMCMSVDQPGPLVGQGEIWSDHALECFEKYPGHFIPTGNGGGHPAWTRRPGRFLAAQERFIVEHRYPLMGEFEVRHYPSPRQLQRGESHRDVDVPIDGPLMERVFAFAERTGIPFQLHYEIEDRLLEPLERMLIRFPAAKVIWCHLTQIRFQQRSTQYGPAMVERWLDRFPNLYFDTAFADPMSTYRTSGERHARYWNQTSDWNALMVAKPYRFLAALDVGGDRMDSIGVRTQNLRAFLRTLPEPTREIVAYKAAWKLLFGEEL